VLGAMHLKHLVDDLFKQLGDPVVVQRAAVRGRNQWSAGSRPTFPPSRLVLQHFISQRKDGRSYSYHLD